uniref:Uncharacterized protein n=1 Tax=Romanomermis culicivorax TaxID=13658 RepID=A0A915KAW6_ROMCU
MGNKFARYISFALTNGQTYVIDTTTLMAKEWTSLHDFLNSDMLFPGYSVLEDLEKELEFNLADPKDNELPKGLIRDDLITLLQRKDGVLKPYFDGLGPNGTTKL